MPFLSRSRPTGVPCPTGPSAFSGIVPRMHHFVAIRVAEPWTTTSIAVLVALVVIVVAMTVWLIHRY